MIAKNNQNEWIVDEYRLHKARVKCCKLAERKARPEKIREAFIDMCRKEGAKRWAMNAAKIWDEGG